MRAAVCFLAMLTMAQPAFACAMDGMYGAHRFSPFQGMQMGMGADLTDQSSNSADSEEIYSYRNDNADDSSNSDAEQDIAELNPDDLPRS